MRTKSWLYALGLSLVLLYPLTTWARAIALPLPPDAGKMDSNQKINRSPGELAAVSGELSRRFPGNEDAHVIIVNVHQQKLYVLYNGKLQKNYAVSTSQWGTGNREGSNQTPLGVFRIVQKFGQGAVPGSIFKARRDTGKLARIIHNPYNRSERDLVTSRIMWLSGLQPGFNEGGDVDTHSRYIYIHGTPEEGRIGTPSSHGCVRMRNEDVIDLFNRVPVGTLVYIATGNVPLTHIPGNA